MISKLIHIIISILFFIIIFVTVTNIYGLSHPISFLYISIIIIVIGLLHIRITKKNSLVQKSYFILLLFSLIILSSLFVYAQTTNKTITHINAQFSVWICDEQIDFFSDEGRFQSRLGSHNIFLTKPQFLHIKGLIPTNNPIQLSDVFQILEIDINRNMILFNATHKNIQKRHGDLCNNQRAQVRAFINGELNNNFSEYTIKDGDCIIIEFTHRQSFTTTKQCI